jgi:hypothetical protein
MWRAAIERRGHLTRSSFRSGGDAGSTSGTEQLSDGGIGEPVLELLGGPAARPDEEKPDIGVVQRPEDVGSLA